MYIKLLLFLSSLHLIRGESNMSFVQNTSALALNNTLNFMDSIFNSEIDTDCDYSLLSNVSNPNCYLNNTNTTEEYFQNYIVNTVYIFCKDTINFVVNFITQILNMKSLTIFSIGYSIALTIYVLYLKHKTENQTLQDFMTSNLYRIPMTTAGTKRENVNNIVTV